MTLPMFKYHFKVPVMITSQPDRAPVSSTSLHSPSPPPPPTPKKIYLVDRSRYYTLTMEKLVDSAEQEEPEDNPDLQEQSKFYSRLRLGIPDEKMRKLELELVKAWSLQHQGERLIELQPDTEEALPPQIQQPETLKPSPKKRSRSRAGKRQKPCKNCRSSGKNQQQTDERSSQVNTPLTKAEGPPSPTDQIARNLAHNAYANQCIVLLDFSGEVDEETNSVHQLISFRVNCVSSQFPSQHRTKLALILETFSYKPSATGSISAGGHSLVDMVFYPLFIFWPGGAEQRAQNEQQSLLKDQQLEALHDSIQIGPYNLPKYYYSTIPGKGYFAFILEAPTTYGRAYTEPSLTYLDRGSSYALRLKNLNFIPGAHPVKLRTCISLRLNSPTEKEQFTNWALMNEGVMLDIDYSKCTFASDPPVVVLDVTRSSSTISNSLTLQWLLCARTDDEVKVAIKLNCLSAQFTTADKANRNFQPLRLTMDTFNDSFEGQSRKIDSSSCLVVVLDQGHSVQQLRADYEQFCSQNEEELKGENDQQSDSAAGQGRPKEAARVLLDSTPLQPSYSSTLFRTSPEFVVNQILFISIGEQNEYRPLFLHRLDVAHFRECMATFLRKWLPSGRVFELLGDIFVLALPEQNASSSHLGQMLTNEMIATKMGSKALFKCVLFKDSHTKKGETDLKLIFQSNGI